MLQIPARSLPLRLHADFQRHSPKRRHVLRRVSDHRRGGRRRPLAVLGRVDTRNLTQRRKGRKDAIIALFYSRFSPRHSRFRGNPEGCSQARQLKSSMNSSQRIPPPFMGLRGRVSNFVFLASVGVVGDAGLRIKIITRNQVQIASNGSLLPLWAWRGRFAVWERGRPARKAALGRGAPSS